MEGRKSKYRGAGREGREAEGEVRKWDLEGRGGEVS